MAVGSSPYLYNPPDDEETWLTWGAIHQSDHFQLASAATQFTDMPVPVLPIDPVLLPGKFPTYMILSWFNNHQAIHNALAAALGIGNFDLSYVDFTKADQRAQWMYQNAYMHQAAAAAIGQLKAEQAEAEAQQAAQQNQSTPVAPQVGGVQPQAESTGNNLALLPQGGPGIQTIQPQGPNTGQQVQAQAGQPQAPDQPFPTLQPQPSPSPPPGIQPGTPAQPGSGGLTPTG